MITRTQHSSFVEYRLENMLHNPSGPARIFDDGRHMWYLHGKVHRYYGDAMKPNHWIAIHGKVIK